MEEVSGNMLPDKQPATLAGLSILVADDEDSSFRAAERILNSFGVSIVRARNGKEAVEVYSSNESIGLIIMDIKMPVMNGIEATRLIRSINNNVPVIAISAFAMPGDRKVYHDAGCNDYIQKPLREETLIAAIMNLIQSKNNV